MLARSAEATSGQPPPAAGAPCDPSDGAVEAALRAGDARGACAALIRAHGARVRGYLRTLLRDADVADDAFSLFQESALAGIARYAGSAPPATWALGVAYNAARRVRAEAWRRRRVRLGSGSFAAFAARPRPSSSVRRERDAQRLEELRGRLSAEEQALLVLRLEQRLDWRQIAQVLAAAGQVVSEQALRKRFERLKEHIGRLARERGYLE